MKEKDGQEKQMPEASLKERTDVLLQQIKVAMDSTGRVPTGCYKTDMALWLRFKPLPTFLWENPRFPNSNDTLVLFATYHLETQSFQTGEWAVIVCPVMHKVKAFNNLLCYSLLCGISRLVFLQSQRLTFHSPLEPGKRPQSPEPSVSSWYVCLLWHLPSYEKPKHRQETASRN